MSEEVVVGDKTYISSKRASELSGYARDYIGQLSRKGSIDAHRIGGLWYIFLDSLMKHKEKAELYVPEAPNQSTIPENPDAVVSFDGKDYVSAGLAADMTGYHPDYVGQLARSGKVLSRQVGNRWFVDRDGVFTHKKEKDALLGAVQAESVGIARTQPDEAQMSSHISNEDLLTYNTEGRPFLPLENKKAKDLQDTDYKDVEETTVPIRVLERRQNNRSVFSSNRIREAGKTYRITRKTIFYAVLCLAIFIVVGGIFVALKNLPTVSDSAADKNDSSYDASNTVMIQTLGVFNKIGGVLEQIITKELVYIRG